MISFPLRIVFLFFFFFFNFLNNFLVVLLRLKYENIIINKYINLVNVRGTRDKSTNMVSSPRSASHHGQRDVAQR